MTTELLEIMQKDIKRCEEAQGSNEGTHRLYQALITKYNGIFEGFLLHTFAMQYSIK